MNLKEIDDLGILIKQAQEHADNMMSTLSESDKEKVNNIVNGVDTNDLESMKNHLKNQKDASRD
mgnify:CR=1 FL=1|tara:strand:- start:236 stop:427 length:192 start_codon:yes stop_codon:yes gene_type:complete